MKQFLLAVLALAAGAQFTAAQAAEVSAARDGTASQDAATVAMTKVARASQPTRPLSAQKPDVDWDFASGHDASGEPVLRS